MKKHKIPNGCGGYDEVDYLINHYSPRSDRSRACRGCGASLDVYGKVIDCDPDVKIEWQVVECQRCHDVTLIDL